MKKSRYTEEQIAFAWTALKKGHGVLQSHLHRKHLFLSSFAAPMLSSVCNRAQIVQDRMHTLPVVKQLYV